MIHTRKDSRDANCIVAWVTREHSGNFTLLFLVNLFPGRGMSLPRQWYVLEIWAEEEGFAHGVESASESGTLRRRRRSRMHCAQGGSWPGWRKQRVQQQIWQTLITGEMLPKTPASGNGLWYPISYWGTIPVPITRHSANLTFTAWGGKRGKRDNASISHPPTPPNKSSPQFMTSLPLSLWAIDLQAPSLWPSICDSSQHSPSICIDGFICI